MTDVILTLNAGSASIKFAAYPTGGDALCLLASGQVEELGGVGKFAAKTHR